MAGFFTSSISSRCCPLSFFSDLSLVPFIASTVLRVVCMGERTFLSGWTGLLELRKVQRAVRLWNNSNLYRIDSLLS